MVVSRVGSVSDLLEGMGGVGAFRYRVCIVHFKSKRSKRFISVSKIVNLVWS